MDIEKVTPDKTAVYKNLYVCLLIATALVMGFSYFSIRKENFVFMPFPDAKQYDRAHNGTYQVFPRDASEIRTITTSSSLDVGTDDTLPSITTNQCLQLVIDTSQYSCGPGVQLRYIDIDYRGEGNHWQAQKVDRLTSDFEERVYAMHAYYDDRPVLEGKVFIRLFVVVTWSSQGSLCRSSFCQLWTDCSEVPIIETATVDSTNGRRRVSAKGKDFMNYIISCEVPKRILEKNIRISKASFAADKCANSTVLIPVIYPPKPPQWEHTFGMCEANGVSFGYFGPEQATWLIEWFEANMLFGITELNIYNGTMVASEPVQKVLDYYQHRGVLHLHQQPPSITNYAATERDVADIAMRTALNDCMYRNMYRYKYAVTIDLDELIVPVSFDNYTAVIDRLEKKNLDPHTKSYTMTAMGFYMKFTDQVDEKVDSRYPLRTSQYLNAVPNPGRVKTFFNPRYCLGAFSHYCLRRFPIKVNQRVSPAEMVVHHYRNHCVKFEDPSNQGPTACKALGQRKKHLGRMLHFEEILNEKLVHVLDLLNMTVYK